MRYFTIVILLIFSISISKSQNSQPYSGKSLIKIQSSNNDIIDALLELNVVPITCRGSILNSNLIVDSLTISWLKKQSVPFVIIHNDLEKTIELEMDNIQKTKNNRSENWYTVYRELHEIEDHINVIVEENEIVTKNIIGQSYEGREITVIKVGVDDFTENKPSIFINGCQHAREWITPMATTYLIEQLSIQYNTNAEVNMLLNLVDIYILPVFNPDGYVYTWEEDRWWRKNRQINLGSDCVGIDLNRNWDFDWNGEQSTSEDPCSYIYVGTAPFSAQETNIVSEYIASIPNLVSHIDVHNYSALIVGPWASSDDQTDDTSEVYCLGTKMQSAVSLTNDYPYIFGTGTVNDLLYLISGGMMDWVYSTMSSLSFLYELRPASLYYYDSNFDGLSAFDNDEQEILATCEEFYQGVLEMIRWAYFDNCEAVTGCSDPEADNYYCNPPLGDMLCLYTVDPYIPPQNNGAYNLLEYGLPLGFVDDGSCIYSNVIDLNSIEKNIIKRIDYLGRDNSSKGFSICIYDDGTVTKQHLK